MKIKRTCVAMANLLAIKASQSVVAISEKRRKCENEEEAANQRESVMKAEENEAAKMAKKAT